MKIVFEKLQDRVLHILDDQIQKGLTYHHSGHTRDVIECVQRIAQEEGIIDERALLLLKIAALYHDTGFLFVYRNHEEKSCEFARKDLAAHELTDEEMDTICSMIMATKIPQKPKSHLEEIICDADLDYLGRDDFRLIGKNLKEEFLKYAIVKDVTEWEEVQINFIDTHKYFTATSQNAREYNKQIHLASLKSEAGMITN
ncbi:MAG: HD domain-containing protein [Flavisolibacter sp.]|jgi:HD superfamily phosphodiesterase|nr:HD domain-containing protein [Flavisolibacter sp.]